MFKRLKRGFTLAETIMTLFIVGLVVTAAIPVFTVKRSNSPSPVNTPWKACDAADGNGGRGLCTDSKVFIPMGSVDTDNMYSLVVYPRGTDESNKIDSPYDIFHSDRRSLKIGNLYFNEGNNNLVISQVADTFSPSTFSSNLIIDSDIRTERDAQHLASTPLRAAGTTSNVIIGRGNTIGGSNQNNVVLGNSNILANGINNSIIFGQGNTANATGSAIVGSGNTANAGFNSTLIGFGPLEHNPSVDATPFINIGDHIYGDPSGITFNGNIVLNNNSLTVTVPATLTSDERLKNIKGSYSKGLKEILQVQPVVFAYKSDPAANENVGVIAQDIQKVFPEAVIPMPSGFLGVDTDPMFFAMINSLKEINADAQAEINRQQALKEELTQLKSELADLSACKANNFMGRIECFINDIKRFFKSLNWFAKGEADEKA